MNEREDKSKFKMLLEKCKRKDVSNLAQNKIRSGNE